MDGTPVLPADVDLDPALPAASDQSPVLNVVSGQLPIEENLSAAAQDFLAFGGLIDGSNDSSKSAQHLGSDVPLKVVF